MAIPYDNINGTLAGQDISYLFIYANSVTNNLFVPVMVLSFFLVVLIGSFVAQQRFSGRVRPELSFLAALFVTIGFEAILIQKNGLLNPFFVVITIVLFIINLVWVIMASSNPYD